MAFLLLLLWLIGLIQAGPQTFPDGTGPEVAALHDGTGPPPPPPKP